MFDTITPLLITYNEERNLPNTLPRLTWARQILVIDSYSQDATLDILKSYPQVTLLQREFDTFATQCNFGLEYVTTPWVLSLDADYWLTDELVRELGELPAETGHDGYYVKFKFCVFGKPLRGALLPPRQVLYRRDRARYVDDGHAHRVQVEGPSGELSAYIYHDDRKPIARWFLAETKYAVIEAKKLRALPAEEVGISDRVRRLRVVAPVVVPLYCLALKGGVLDGWRGWYYAFQRTIAELLLSMHLIQDDLTDAA